MKDNIREIRVCPLCGKAYAEPPALSRTDNETLICPDCGVRQALESIGINTEEQDKMRQPVDCKTEEKFSPFC